MLKIPAERFDPTLTVLPEELLKLGRSTKYVMGHRNKTLDNQCGATITNSIASGASLPLCKRAEEGKQLGTD